SWRSLMCALPLVSVNLSVVYAPQFSSSYHYDDFASVFLLVAAMHGTVAVLRAVDSAFKGRRLIAYAFIVLFALLLTEPTRNAISFLQWSWFGDKERPPELTAYRALVALLAPEPATFSAIAYLQRSWPGDNEWQLYQELAVYRSLPFEIGIAADQALGPY